MHHTVTAVDYAPEESAGIVLGIARYHRDSNGWNDIGYNFLVDRYGVIFEGRAGGVEAAVIGAQAQGWNSVSTGIACLGTFTNIPLDAPAMESLARLIGWKLSLHGVPVQGQVTLESGGGESNRYPAGTLVNFERISGHRDGCETSCPGEQLYAQLPDLRARAARYSHPVSAITVKAASQKGARPTSVSGVAALRRRLLARRRARSASSTWPAGSAWTQVTTTTCGARRQLGHERAAARLAARSARCSPATPRAPRLESAPVDVKVVPSMSLTSDKRRAKAGTAFAVSGTLAPEPGARAVPPGAPGRQPLGDRPAQAHQRARRPLRRPRCGRRRPGLYRVSIIADGVTRRRTLRALH